MIDNAMTFEIKYKCPYCHGSILDGKHIVDNFKFCQMIGCPQYPKSNNPIFINKGLWIKNTPNQAK